MAKNIKMSIASKAREAITNSFSSLEAIKKNILILDELKSFIPPLLDTEFEQLKINLLANGCKDPLLLWETTQDVINEGPADETVYVLIDGHNRYRICTEYGINFNTQLLAFDNMSKVKEHMIDLQLGRRNLNPQQVSYFRGLRYNNEKNNLSNNFNSKNDAELMDNSPNGQNDHLENYPELTTAQRLADQYNVGEKTIRRDADFAKGLDKLTPNLKNEVLSGKTKIERTKIQLLAKNNEIQEPISEINQIELYVKPISDKANNDSKLGVSSIDKLAKQKFNNLLKAIDLVYKTRKLEDFEFAQKAFEDFKVIL
jgi:type VI protein secretion system component Hcp